MEVVPNRRTILTTGLLGVLAFYGRTLVPGAHHLAQTTTAGAGESLAILTGVTGSPESGTVASLRVPTTDYHTFQIWVSFVITWLQVHGYISPSSWTFYLLTTLEKSLVLNPVGTLLEYLATAVMVCYSSSKLFPQVWRLPRSVYRYFFPVAAVPRLEPIEQIALSVQKIAQNLPRHSVGPVAHFRSNLLEPLSWVGTLVYMLYRVLTWTPRLSFAALVVCYQLLRFLANLAVFILTFPFSSWFKRYPAATVPMINE